LTMKDCAHFKLHPEPYLKALELGGCSAEECLVVEDSPRGLAAAVAAGIRCVVIPSRFTRGGCFEGAYKMLTSVRDLPGLLDGKD